MRTCAYTAPGILSGLGRRGIYGFLLVFAISASTCFAETVGPQLTLDPVNVKQEGSVSFSVLSVGIEARSDFPGPRFVPAQTEEGAFRLYMDVDSIQQVRFNDIFLPMLLSLGVIALLLVAFNSATIGAA